MSYIPARAMHHARSAPAPHEAPALPAATGAWERLTAAAERISPRTWTIGALAAGALAVGALVTARSR